MRSLLIIAALGVLFGSSTASIGAERFYLEPAPVNARISGTIAIPSGGNVGPYPNAAGQVPTTGSGDYRLEQSAVGFFGPSAWAGGSTVATLRGIAQMRVVEGTQYRTEHGGGGWNLVFPGVINTATGAQVSGNQNYFSNKLIEAEGYYRAWMAAFPHDLEAKEGMLNAIREQIVPLAYAGNQAFARATRERILDRDRMGDSVSVTPGSTNSLVGNASSINSEMSMLVHALSHYDAASRIFVEFTSQSDSFLAFPDLPQGQGDPMINRLREAQRNLLASYGRVLHQGAEALHRYAGLWYFREFQAPTESDPTPLPTLLDYLEDRMATLQAHLLVVSVFEKSEWFPVGAFAGAASTIDQLAHLRRAIEAGELVFVGLDGSLKIHANTYTPYYVPFFFEPLLNPNQPTTYAGLSTFARGLAQGSQAADDLAQNAGFHLDQNVHELVVTLNSHTDRFEGELGQLCGYTTVIADGVARRVPALVNALISPDDRPEWQSLDPEDRGQIGLQWLEISAAEARLDRGINDLNGIGERINKRNEIFQRRIASTQDFVDNVILANGEKLSGLESISGDIQATAIKYTAQLNRERQKRKSWSGKLFDKVMRFGGPGLILNLLPKDARAGLYEVASQAINIVPVFGGAASGSLASAANALHTEGDIASALRSSESQADVARQLADIQSKKAQIATLEKAAFQWQQVDEEAFRLEEAVHSLLIDARQAELNVMMASLDVRREEEKLATLHSRVAFLLQQYASWLSLVDSNPLNSPDFQVIRDRTAWEAEDRFVFAQEWCFLAGRAAEYVAFGDSQFAAVREINREVLRARTGSRLTYLLDKLQAVMNQVTLSQGTRTQPMLTPVSLRDYVWQNNKLTRDAEGDPIASLRVSYEYQDVSTPDTSFAGTTKAASDEEWRQFLNAHLVPVPENPSLIQLRIPFRLSLKADSSGNSRFNALDRRQNPLFRFNEYGTLIFYQQGNPNAFGVRLNIKGRSIEGINPVGQRVTATLSPEGTSYIRGSGWNANPQDIRVYYLGRDRRSATIESAINGQPQTLANPQMHERSPANDRWVITITSDTSANNVLLQQLDKISDIELNFSLSSHTQN